MKASEIRVGGHYSAKVNGRLTTVRVDTIRYLEGSGYPARNAYTRYDVTNLATGRKTTFRSAQKFRSIASDGVMPGSPKQEAEQRPDPISETQIQTHSNTSNTSGASDNPTPDQSHIGSSQESVPEDESAGASTAEGEQGSDPTTAPILQTGGITTPEENTQIATSAGSTSLEAATADQETTKTSCVPSAEDGQSVATATAPSSETATQDSPATEVTRRPFSPATPTTQTLTTSAMTDGTASGVGEHSSGSEETGTAQSAEPSILTATDDDDGYEWSKAAIEAGYGSDNPPPAGWQPSRAQGGEDRSDPTSAPMESATMADTQSDPAKNSAGGGFAKQLASSTVLTSNDGLTEEQQQILATAPNVQVLVIEAGAGCGKTFTLKKISEVMEGTGQYTAFNASLVAESKQKFSKRVRCNTIHSLAFGGVGYKYQHRLGGKRIMSGQLAAMLGLQPMTFDGPDGNPKTLTVGALATQVRQAVYRFTQSRDRYVSQDHFRPIPGIDKEGEHFNSDMVRELLLPLAVKMWEDKCSPTGTMPFIHDDYVKIWELSKPVIGADYLLGDEWQDVAPVMQSIFDQQVERGMRTVLVGDSNQQIYSWRGAINGLACFPGAPRLFLSKSFRFGQVVAEVANAILEHLQEPTKLVMRGFEKINSKLAPLESPTAVLCRTNAGALGRLLEGVQKGKRPCLIGKCDDIVSFVKAAISLGDGQPTEHPELCVFKNWKEVQAFSKTEEGDDLKLMVKLIDEFSPKKILNALERMPREEDADLVLSTAHKSKGREWKKVQLASDFKTLDKMGDEEIRLLYVAATRAQHVLDCEDCPPFVPGRRDKEGNPIPHVDLSEARKLSKEIRDDPVQPRPQGEEEAPKAAPPPQEARQEQAQACDNTWSKGHAGIWLVRGMVGQSGAIRVKRKDGGVKVVTVKRVVWQNEEVALYEVAQ